MMRQPVRIRRWAAALLALVAPLVQQRPALLDAMPMPAAVPASAHPVAATDAGANAGSECAEHATSSHGKAPVPHLPWCCELALVPTVTSPWLVPRIAVAPLVAIVRPEARNPVLAHVPPRQTRLPFATAPPSARA